MHVKHRLAALLLASSAAAAFSLPVSAAPLPVTSRYAHTATLLADGNVLIVGGQSDDAPTIVTAVEMALEGSHALATVNNAAPYVARTSHTATLLPTGEVLIAGGMTGAATVADNVQIYSPELNCWRPVVAFTKTGGKGRFNHTATLLKNGQVLLCGGQGDATTPGVPFAASATCDLFTPTIPAPAACGGAGGTMDATGVTLQAPRALHTATLLNDGRVYLVGGMDNTGTATNPYLITAEIYAPGANGTLAASGLITARAYHRATLMGNGKVLIVGGSNNNVNQVTRGFLDSTEIYDAVADKTSPGGQLAARLSQQAQTINADGTIVFSGGLGNITPTVNVPLSFPMQTAPPPSFLTGTLGAFPTMNITGGSINLSVSPQMTLGPLATGTILDGFILFANPKLTFPSGASASLPSGVADPVTDVLSGTFFPLNNVGVGCSTPGTFTTCGTVLTSGMALVPAGGTYAANPVAGLKSSISAMSNAGPSGSVNVSTVDWTPHGLSSTGTASGTVTPGTILQGDITLTGLPAEYVGADIAQASLAITGGSFNVAGGGGQTIYAVTIQSANGTFNAGFGTSPQVTQGGNGGQITARLTITSVTGTVAALTPVAQDPCFMPGQGTPCPAGQGQSVGGQALTNLTGTLTFAPTRVNLAGSNLTTPTSTPPVIRKMVMSDLETYTPTKNTWAYTDHAANGGGNFGTTATLEPTGTLRRFGGRLCFGAGCALSDAGGVLMQFPGLTGQQVVMNSPRANMTATNLPSGKILLAGGTNGPNVLPTAEVFDPLAQTFTPTGPMTVARDIHTATLLPNGRVLVAGGFATTSVSSGATNAAEIYFPNTNNWIAASPMPVAADNHSATLLPDGNVLVAGGFSSGSYLPNAEIYITTMGVWRPLPSMPQPRAAHTATLLQDGRVLLAGGVNATGVLCTAYIYDPNYQGAGAPWYQDTNIGGGACAGVQGHSATLLKNGNVLLAGGNNSFGEVSNSYRYVPAVAPAPDNAPAPGTWINTTPALVNVKRFNHSSLLLPNGDVMLLGGAQALGNAVNSIETFDTALSSWQITGGLSKARFGAAAVVGLDGNIYLFGGSNGVTIENTFESAYFTGSVDGSSLGVPPGTRKPVLAAVSTMPFSGSAYSSVPAINGPAVTITGKSFMGFGEAAGGGAASGNSSHHNPRLILQSMGGSGGVGSQHGGMFTLDLTTAIYAAGNLWPAVDTGILVNVPNVVGSNASPPGPGGTIMPYGWYQLRDYSNAVYSDALPVQVGPPKPPLPPASVQISNIGVTSITWTWSMPGGMAANQVDGWELFSSSNGVFVTTTTVAQTTFQQSNLAPNSTMTIAIAGYTTSGDGPLGYSTTYYTYCSSPSFTTYNGFSSTFTNISFNGLTLNWDPDGNSPGAVYEVYQSTDNFNLNVTTPVPTIFNLVSTSVAVGFLQPNQDYYFKVRAFNGSGLPGPFSVVVTTRTRAPVAQLSGAPAGAPYSPTTTIQWTWKDPGGVKYYNVYNATVPVGAPGYLIVSTGNPTYFDVGLATNSARAVMISAVTNAGEGPLSGSATAFTLAAVPGAVGAPIINLSTGSFSAFWTANGNPLFTQYQMVVLDANGNQLASVLTGNFNANYGAFAAPSGASQFSVQVNAVNGAGQPSAFLVLGTTFTLPDNPSNLTITGTTPNSISLSWLGNNNSSSATYEVQYTTSVDFNNLGAIQKAVSFASKFGGTSLTVPNLLTSTTYQFRVQASNPVGQLSAFAASVTTSPFNGGAPLGSISGPIVHGQTTMLTGTIGGGRSMTLLVPANAFPADTFVTVSTFDASGVNSKCPGGVNIGVSITPNPYIQPLHPVFLTLGYTPAELGAVPTSQAALSRVDPSGTCVPLQTTVDTTNNLLTAQLNHFSLFQVANVAPASDPSTTVVFPNPFMPGQGNGYVTFKNMPASARVRIFTLRGDLVYDMTANGSGLAIWGGTNRFGRPAASGVYLAVVESGGQKNILKLVVLR